MPSRHIFSITIIAMCWLYIYQPVGIILLVMTLVLAVLRVVMGVHCRNYMWNYMRIYRIVDFIIFLELFF